MPRAITAQVSAYQRDRVHRSNFVRGDKFTLTANLKNILASGATISSVVWRVTNPQAIIMASPAISGATVTVSCTAGTGGGATVKAIATASNGAVITQLFNIRVTSSPWFQGETAPAQGAYSVSA